MPSGPSVIRPSSLDPFFISLDTLYQQGYMQAQTTYQDWAMTVPSSSKETRHGWLDKIPKVREWLGPRDVQNLVAQEYTIENKMFELTYAVKRTDLEDDNLGLLSPAVQMLGAEAKQWPDTLMTQILEGGAGANPAINAITFDGTDFFSTSHPQDTTNPGANLQSNLYTGAGSGATLLTAQNLSTVRAAMRNFKGRDGLPLGMNVTRIIVPPALESTALQIANAEFIVTSFGTNAATGSQTNILKGSFNVTVNPKLTSDTTWYAVDDRLPIKPFVWQLREAPEFTYLVSPNDQNVFNRDEYLYGIRARGNGGYGLWFMAIMAGA